MTGRVGNLTSEQAEALKKFKLELANEGFFKVRFPGQIDDFGWSSTLTCVSFLFVKSQEGTGPEKSDMYGGGLTGASHDDATLL
jgi:hypothetical protein